VRHYKFAATLYSTPFPDDSRGFLCNWKVQYLSLVLRLSDILDLDPERTPIGLFDFIKPQNRVSLVEWQKHRSVVGWEITPQRFRFECECSEPEYERALRQFLGWIEEERRDSVMLATSQRDDLAEIYHLDCVDPVTTDRIRSNGSYIFSNLRFSLDYQRVLELLMGERLYGNPVLALRELLQNAFDAVRVRAAMESKGNELFKPEVTVTLEGNRLIVEDNGCGMDDEIVRKYFMQVGRSYYSNEASPQTDEVYNLAPT